MELGRNRVRAKRIDVWQQAVDTEIFNPSFRCQAMRERLSGGKQDPVILAYVGRLGAGMPVRFLLQMTQTLPVSSQQYQHGIAPSELHKVSIHR